jgi:secretion/DNA translocation related TadE-like protein
VSENGFGSAVMLALLALAGLLCMAVADAANVLVARARAQAAADAAALAAATAQWPFTGQRDPEDAAAQGAEDNGASLESCECPERGEKAVVVVSLPTRIRMLGVAPPVVYARAEASLEPGRIFSRPAS